MMPIWSFAFTIFFASAMGCNLFASENNPASQPSGLKIDRLEFPDGTQCKLDASGKPKSFVIHIVLSNPTDSPLDIWEPTRDEGIACPELIFTSAAGRQMNLVQEEIPQTGPPFSRTIPAHSTLSISRNLADLALDHPLPAGKYRLQVIYQNQIAEIGPVANVWTGSITSNSYPIEFVKPN